MGHNGFWLDLCRHLISLYLYLTEQVDCNEADDLRFAFYMLSHTGLTGDA